jgi:hypothetical protein
MTGRPHIDWQEYYASYDFPSLLADGVTWSDTASVNQMGAYLVRLIDVACDDPALGDADRIKAARLAGSVEDAIRNGLAAQDPEMLGRFEQALAATLDRASRFALYPQVADVIASGQFAASRKR